MVRYLQSDGTYCPTENCSRHSKSTLLSRIELLKSKINETSTKIINVYADSLLNVDINGKNAIYNKSQAVPLQINVVKAVKEKKSFRKMLKSKRISLFEFFKIGEFKTISKKAK